MKRLDADADRRTVALTASRLFYSPEAVELAAAVFDLRAEVSTEASRDRLEVTLRSKKRAPLSEPEREALAGEFLNEMLNQEYRLLVSRFNSRIADLIVTQTLYCARGKDVERVAAESSREFKAEVDALMKEAREEIKKTMPRKISPSGALAS